MKTVYLSNGQACYLKEEIAGKFIVNKIYEFEDEDWGAQETTDNQDIVVDKVFYKKPTAKISAEVKELQIKKQHEIKEIQELNNEKRKLRYEIEQITRTQINNEKFIINRSELMEAKTLVLFPKDRIMPYTLNDEGKSLRGLKVSFEIKISDGVQRAWGYKLYYDYGNDYGQYLCEKYGILINPTQEEIDNTIIKRLAEIKFKDEQIAATDDKYLTDDLLKIKRNYLEASRVKKKESLEKTLKETQAKLNSLITELNEQL